MRNKGVSPVGKIVSVARSKPALVTRYRPRMIGHDLLPLPSSPLLPFYADTRSPRQTASSFARIGRRNEEHFLLIGGGKDVRKYRLCSKCQLQHVYRERTREIAWQALRAGKRSVARSKREFAVGQRLEEHFFLFKEEFSILKEERMNF